MKSMLIITTLDYENEANQRVHNMVEKMKKQIPLITIIYFAQCRRDSIFNWMKQSMLFNVRESSHGNISLFQVNPMGNFPETFAAGIMKFPEDNVKWHRWKKILLRTLNLLGIYKSISTTVCYFLAYMIKLRKQKYDIGIVEGPWDGLVGLTLKYKKRIKKLIYQDIDYVPGNLSNIVRKKITERIELFCMARSDLVISCGKLLKEYRQAKLNKEVIFIPNGVNNSKWIKSKAKIPHPPTMVYMGNIMDWSGLHWILNAMVDIKEKNPKIHLMIIGKGHPEYVKKLMRKIKINQLQDNVEMTGFVPYEELPFYLKKADIGIATFNPIQLLKYAFPLKIIEYMSAGLPIIASKETESARIARQFGCGISITYGNIEEFSNAVINLVEDRNLYLKFAVNSEKGSRYFSWDKLMELQYSYMKSIFKE